MPERATPLDFSLLSRILLPLVLLLALKVSPQPAALQQAFAALNSGRPADAARQWAVVTDYQPWRLDAWEQRAAQDLAVGDAQAALTDLQQAAARGSLSRDGKITLGQALYQTGETQRALRIWQQLLAQNGPAPDVLAQIARLQLEQGDLPAAYQALQAWLALEPENARALYGLGLVGMFEDPSAAVASLLHAARVNSRYQAAADILRTAVNTAQLSDDAGYRWLLIGRGLARVGHWDLAARAFERALLAAPQYAEAWAFLGEAHQQLGQDGYPALQKAQQLNDHSVIVQALAAVYYRRQGQPRQALVYLQRAAAEEPQEATWQIELGNTQAEIGDLVAALDYFRKAVELAPRNPEAWKALASFCANYDVSLRDDGLPAARQAVLLRPEDAAASDLLGWTLFRLGDAASAERVLLQALGKNGNNALAHLHLGQVYLSMGQQNPAYLHLQRAADLDAEGMVGKTARRLLDTLLTGG